MTTPQSSPIPNRLATEAPASTTSRRSRAERKVLEPGATSRIWNEALYHAMKEEEVRHDIHDVDGKDQEVAMKSTNLLA
jgi:hypothetical protein